MRESTALKLVPLPFRFFTGTRRILLDKFPYSVYYVVLVSKITVLAVIHHKRDPELAQRISE